MRPVRRNRAGCLAGCSAKPVRKRGLAIPLLASPHLIPSYNSLLLTETVPSTLTASPGADPNFSLYIRRSIHKYRQAS